MVSREGFQSLNSEQRGNDMKWISNDMISIATSVSSWAAKAAKSDTSQQSRVSTCCVISTFDGVWRHGTGGGNEW
jgi:hypothetical protein